MHSTYRGPYSQNPATYNRMDKKKAMEGVMSMMAGVFNFMIDDLTCDNAVDEDEKVTLAVLFEMVKEEQKKKKNVKDRISDNMIDKVAEMALSEHREAAFWIHLKANYRSFDHVAVCNIQKEALEIKKTNSFKVRFAEAMQAQKKSDSDDSEDEEEIQLTGNTVSQFVATKSNKTSKFAGSSLFIVSICLFTALSAVFYHDFFNLFV